MIVRSVLLLGTGLCCLFGTAAHSAPTFVTLAIFNGRNGSDPVGALTFDRHGNLYGATRCGGAGTTQTHCGYNGNGTVFKLAGPSYRNIQTLFSFNGGMGDTPVSALVADAAGNLFGATNMDGPTGFGGVFELSGANHGTFHNLQDFFTNNLTAAVMFDGAGQPSVEGQPYNSGHLFGTTNGDETSNTGEVFDLSGANYGKDVVRYTFPLDQSGPTSPLIADAFGNLYGTTTGEDRFGDGPSTVCELSGPHHTRYTTLAIFDGASTGEWPGALVFDKFGNLYGLTKGGGSFAGGTLF